MKTGAYVVAGMLIAGLPQAAFSQTQTESVAAPVIVTGEVVRYEPGKILVLRIDGQETTYTLAPSITMPSEVQVGRNVSVHTERGSDGNTVVTRVTTTSVTPEGRTKRTTEETRQEPGGVVRQRKTTTVSGEVMSYEPGRTIVVRPEGGEAVTYTLGPKVLVPAEVQVGRKVTLFTEPGLDGNTVVARVTTTSVTPEGQVKRTTEETRTKPSGETSKLTTVTVQGTLQAMEPGKSITVLRPDGTKVLYVIGQGATLPPDLAIGKVVTIRSLPVVETIIIDKQ
ncbi:MAG TPA: hypothetical protein VF310_15830 [Vicinamibacteria bacterium]